MKVKRLFSENQLSMLFQIGLNINVLQLLFTMIIYHFFPQNNNFIFILNIIDQVSFILVGTILISQALLVFTYRHQTMINRYKLFGVTIIISMGIFFLWLINIDNDMQQKFIEFMSNAARTDHNSRVIFATITLFLLLVLDFYRTVKNPVYINENSVPELIRQVLQLVVRKYLGIFIITFGIIHVKKLHNFALWILQYSKSTIEYDLSWLEILIPAGWIIALIIFLWYRLFKHKNLELHIKD
ncbi:MAG: hypothetical protein ACXWL2_02560 [Candidatus Chromulinivorax sp.]